MDEYLTDYAASHALVIGINSYTDPHFVPLGEAETDAQAFADLLSSDEFGFQVTTLMGEQATKDSILDNLFNLRDSGPDDRILVYFAGHGYTMTDRFDHETGYLACFDTIADRDHTALELEQVTDLRRHAEAKHIGFIFDACFSGQALGLTRAASDVAADKFLLRRSYQILSAGAGDQTVSDYKSMTRTLIDALQRKAKEMITLNSLGLHVQQAITADSGKMQIPQFGHLQGSQGGDIVFYAPPQVSPFERLSERMQRGLMSDDADTRYFAVEKLVELVNDLEIGDAALEVLNDIAITDPDDEIRRLAVEHLKASSNQPAAAPDAIEPVVDDVEPTPQKVVEKTTRAARMVKPAMPAGRSISIEVDRIIPVSAPVAWTYDGKCLAYPDPNSDHRRIMITDVETGDLLDSFEPELTWPYTIVCSRVDSTLLVISTSNQMQMYDYETGELYALLPQYFGAVTTAWWRWSPDGRRLAGVQDQTIIVANLEDGTTTTLANGHRKAIASIAWSPDGRRLLSGGGAFFGGTPDLIIWNVETGKIAQSLSAYAANAVRAVAWSSDGDQIASAGDDNDISIWDVGTLKPTILATTKVPTYLEWSPSGQFLANAAGSDVRIWDMQSRILMGTFSRQFGGAYVSPCVWSPDERWLATTTVAEGLTVWKVLS